MTVDKRLLKLAIAIRSEFVLEAGRSPPPDLPKHSWDCCVDLVRQCHRADVRNWHLAAAELRHDLSYEISALQSSLSAVVANLPRNPVTSTVSSVGEIYRDLVALNAEFDQVDFDVATRRISVTTEPITLENLYLGPFEIRLNCSRMIGDRSYRVVALDPHPASSRDNVTHPHVLDEQMCEGESHVAIRQALSQGRLLDFFTLVATGLRSYNADSPFVSVEHWFGSRCADCGYAMDEDEGYTCERCNATVCNDCEVTCNACDRCYCGDCAPGCNNCGDGYCRSCLSTCVGCQLLFCSHCLTQERCAACHETQQPTEVAKSRTAVQPQSVGEALVPP